MAKAKKTSKNSVKWNTVRRAKYERQFSRTAANLRRKGKTNKKLHKNPKAIKFAR